jgi:tryptophanyl-tRNA synthetase
MTYPKVLSGIRPTGRFHLGNYLGALKSWVNEQNFSDTYYAIVDLHALADDLDPQKLASNCFKSTCFLLAIGIDPEKSTLFLQSQVAYHTELTWILSSIATFGELNRMTQFKEKAGKKDLARVALFTYPVLMAADILLYKANKVPVGEDQKQHLELTRNLAQRFNNRFGETFVIPEPLVPKTGARVMDLQNPLKKMSKSEGSDLGIIYLDDSNDLIKKKILKAVTDSAKDIVYDPVKRPGSANLLNILASLKNQDPFLIACEFQSYKSLKEALIEAVIEEITPIRERFEEFCADKEKIKRILLTGANKAASVAEKTIREVRQRIGLSL